MLGTITLTGVCRKACSDWLRKPSQIRCFETFAGTMLTLGPGIVVSLKWSDACESSEGVRCRHFTKGFLVLKAPLLWSAHFSIKAACFFACLLCSRTSSLSRCRQQQARYHPLWTGPPRHRSQQIIWAALPGREGDAVVEGPAEGAGGESGRWHVHTAHQQGSTCSHGPLHLLGEELGGASLHLCLCQRYRWM